MFNFVKTDCGFTYERLMLINEEDLKAVFPGQANIGLRPELREKIVMWKSKNLRETPHTIVPEKCNTLAWINSQQFSHSLSSSPLSPQSGPNIMDILKSSSFGNFLLNVYAKKKSCHDDRKKLLNLITEHYYLPKENKYYIPRPHEMKAIAEAITEIFPTESKDIYYISRSDARKPNPSGMLYNRFNNLNRKRLKTEKLATTTSEVDLTKIDIHPDILSQQNKMRFMSGDENDSMDMWISTHEFRCSDNKVATGLSDVLNRWPFYKQASRGEKY
ncbi:uncharacterized protein [Eurosta solidaginis]|uniref:uncharacterized protein n=1 Tax=Eurosta solidaginis TaxID=178769 RepID=UPI0035306BC9